MHAYKAFLMPFEEDGHAINIYTNSTEITLQKQYWSAQ